MKWGQSRQVETILDLWCKHALTLNFVYFFLSKTATVVRVFPSVHGYLLLYHPPPPREDCKVLWWATCVCLFARISQKLYIWTSSIFCACWLWPWRSCDKFANRLIYCSFKRKQLNVSCHCIIILPESNPNDVVWNFNLFSLTQSRLGLMLNTYIETHAYVKFNDWCFRTDSRWSEINCHFTQLTFPSSSLRNLVHNNESVHHVDHLLIV